MCGIGPQKGVSIMEKRFIVPAVTMLVGLIVWILFLLMNIMEWSVNLSLGIEIAIGLAVGGLVVFSGVRCLRVGGPRAGIYFRSGLLFLLAVLTYWKIGMEAAVVLLIAAIAAGSVTFMKSGEKAASEDTVPASSRTPAKAD
jgi:hypothetical protein